MKEPFFTYATQTVVFDTFEHLLKGGCTRCSLSRDEVPPIIYRGNPKAKIMLVGEAPGLREEEQRRPFVGPAGELLDKIFSAIKMDTNEDMFIANSIMCRPTASIDSGKQNNTPTDEQLEACAPFLENLIKIIKPKVIIACGRIALQQLKKDSKVRLGDFEGKWDKYQNIDMFTMIHPAALLHIKDYKEAYQEKKIIVKSYMDNFKKEILEKGIL